MSLRHAVVCVGSVGLAGCLWGHGVAVERPNAAIAGTKYKVIATIAAGSGRMEIRMSATVRQQLNQAGWKGVARSGRWDSQAEAVKGVCGDGDLDGVLFVAYNRLELYDCASHQVAYLVEGSPERGVGLDEMTKRLMRYLRGEPPLPSR